MIEQDIESSGGSLLPNAAIMLASTKQEIVINNKRCIRSGFVETDLTGLDPSVIKSNSYFDNLPSAPGIFTGGDVVNRWDVGGGTIIVGNSSTVYRSVDDGVTWDAISLTALGSTGYCTSITTDGQGNWWGTYNTASANVIYSDDDGLTWSIVTTDVAALLGTGKPMGIRVARDTGTLILFSDVSGSSDTNGKILRSIDGGVNWTDVAGDLFGNYHKTLALVSHGNGNWLVIGGTNASSGYKKVMVSYDDGATWSTRSLGWDTGTNPDDSVVSRLILNGYEYWIYVSDNENAEGRQHITCVVTEEGSTNRVDTFYLEQEEFPFYTATSKYEQARFIHHQIINGVVYFANGMVTTDGISYLPNGNAYGHDIIKDTVMVEGNPVDKLYVKNDDVNVKTIYLAKDAAGSVFPYSEGAAAQYIVITE